MICTFMNKNRKLFDFEYNEQKQVIENIFNVTNKEWLPYSLFGYKDENDLYIKFNAWINSRYLKNSSWFKKQQWQYGELALANDIVIKSYGLSLSDQYFIKPAFSSEEWKDINFFLNDFKYQSFIINMNRVYDYKDVDVLYSPNIVTGGELNKTWAILEDGRRVLYKSSNTFLGLEPINECIASKISEILEVDYVKYDIVILSNLDKKTMVSSCETFINEDTEFIPAASLFNESSDNILEQFTGYINFLDGLGISNSKEKLQKMFLLDYIMGNGDRHLNNYGVIRNVETLEYVSLAPIFDTGRSMTTEFNSFDDYDRTFTVFRNLKVPMEEYKQLLRGLVITNEQLQKLKEIPDKYRFFLEKYDDYVYLNTRSNNIKENIINFISSNIDSIGEFVQVKD